MHRRVVEEHIIRLTDPPRVLKESACVFFNQLLDKCSAFKPLDFQMSSCTPYTEGVGPGDVFTATTPSGRQVQVTAPGVARPGLEFQAHA